MATKKTTAKKAPAAKATKSVPAPQRPKKTKVAKAEAVAPKAESAEAKPAKAKSRAADRRTRFGLSLFRKYYSEFGGSETLRKQNSFGASVRHTASRWRGARVQINTRDSPAISR